MKNVYIISGPPGVGKSSVSWALAKKIEKSVYIDGDMLYHQVVNGYVSPWKKNNHLRVLYELLISMTNIYLEYGYTIIIDYFIFFEDYKYLKNRINSNNINFTFLFANEGTIINRDLNRTKDKQMGDRVIEAIDEIKLSDMPYEYILDTTNMKIEDIVEQLLN